MSEVQLHSVGLKTEIIRSEAKLNVLFILADMVTCLR